MIKQMSLPSTDKGLSRHQLLIVWLLGLGVMAGQLIRVPLLSNFGSAVSVLDVSVGVALIIELRRLIVGRQQPFKLITRLDKFWLAFQLVLATSFLLGLIKFSSNWQIALAYQLRLQSYLLLYWVVKSWSLTDQGKTQVWRYLIALATILASVGFVQLVLFDDFALLTQFGWDPHIGRLTSTWLDPNYFGAFLAVGLTFVLAKWFTDQSGASRWRTSAIFLFMATAAFFCYSRSGWGSLIIMTSLLGFRANWKVGLVVCLALTGMLFSPTRLGGRFGEAINATKIDQSGAVTTQDPTSEDRVDSWERGLAVIESAPVLGVGYNNFGEASRQLGRLKTEDFAGHTFQGSDSSLLNIWATTGLLGLGLLIGILVMIAENVFRRPRTPTDFYSLATATALIGLTIDSFFINSLFYAPIFATWVVLAGLSPAPEEKK